MNNDPRIYYVNYETFNIIYFWVSHFDATQPAHNT